MSDGIAERVYFVAEATYGVTPAASPAFQRLRKGAVNLSASKNVINSQEVESHRQISFAVKTQTLVSGTIGFELSVNNFHPFIEALLGGTWTGGELEPGNVRRSFSILRHFTDQSSGKPYHMLQGCEVNTMTLTIPANGIITGEFGFIGKRQLTLADLSAYGTPTFPAPDYTEAPLTADGSEISEDGSASNISALEMTLSITNNMTPRYAVGSEDVTQNAAIGQLVVTGSVNHYFENNTLYDKMNVGPNTAFDIIMVDNNLSGNGMSIELPDVLLEPTPIETAAQGTILMNTPFRALYDEVSGYSITVRDE